MTKPMLIEALKPGMRAKVRVSERDHDPVVHVDGFIKWELTWKDCDVETLKSADYEIIPDEPKPWAPTKGHGGFVVMPYMGEIELLPGNSDHWKFALKTPEAAKHKAKLDRIHTAILNMPGYGGDGAVISYDCANDTFFAVDTKARNVMQFPFDTFENAKAAASYANKLMEASHA